MKPKPKRTKSKKPKIVVFGLTGGVAAGKSEFGKILSAKGLSVIDADAIARGLRKPGTLASRKIKKIFGTNDPRKIRQIIFVRPELRKKLERVLHPLIQKESERLFKKSAKRGKPIIYEASLLIETGRYQDFMGLIVVSAPLKIRIKRLMQRDRISKSLAQKIIDAQISDRRRRNAADFWIWNNGSRNELKKKANELLVQLAKYSSTP